MSAFAPAGRCRGFESHPHQVLLQTGRLKIARNLTEGELLAKELRDFRVRIDPATSRDSFLSWREGQNDDLVFALAVALWIGEKENGIVPGTGLIVCGMR